jgi:Tfp pilus assembly protein PilF
MRKIAIIHVMLIILLIISGGCTSKNRPTRYPSQRVKPGSAEAYLNEGIFYLNTGNIDMAEKKLLKALKKKPTLVLAINGLGIVYLNKREFRKSLDYFKKVINLNPSYYDAYNYIGVVYTELGEYSLARENLLIAANADKYKTPENAYVNLTLLEIRQSRFDAALRYVEKGLEINERFAPLSNLKGVILENQGKYTEALQWYEKALSYLTEEDASYLVNIGRVYIKMNQKDKALDVLEKALTKAYTEEMKTQIRDMIKGIEKK